ncbi:putative FMN-dependent luciferase-like monooxygenase [Mycobacterium sp. KBS0706]|uniref:putative FMN-dependent luciferase-like monooxygenase n=1 Tax=Mycobacterium sp. KBS0706 TaxID=2578109 RepID=UPI00110FDC48|nr:putative FMN-dependent luciferase-like monooxygenase [Mycobacterium sp. KBS0706]TSD82863.1 putative FMN-dependent luciferase-like monooxygenase [Mycobacterium sp. KBS0706]
MTIQRLGFFTRLLDEASAQERYRLATEQITTAERHGFDSAWVAQHHFHEPEGGLPAPLVFLAQVAARTSRIRLGTGIITLPLEHPVRVAEDAAVLDLLSDGRLEIGVGTGGTPSAFAAFGLDSAERSTIFARHLQVLLDAWGGKPLDGADTRLYPAAPQLLGRIWQATFSVAGGARAGAAGDGLMLSRTQPRPAEVPHATLAEIQDPVVDAYLAALPAGKEPRILASRSVYVADSRDEARRFAERGLRRQADRFAAAGRGAPGDTLDQLIAAFDVHLGTPDEVIASLRADDTLRRATDLVVQVHSVDPPHPFILRSIELVAQEVAPAFGWARQDQGNDIRLAAASC